MENHNQVHAVFALIEVEPGKYAATTRPYDKKSGSKIGLPGGKVDPGETPFEAVLRECEEEGWHINNPDSNVCEIIHQQLVDGKLVVWFLFKPESATKLENYKEKDRGIKPILATKEELIASGYGNENIPFEKIMFNNTRGLEPSWNVL